MSSRLSDDFKESIRPRLKSLKSKLSASRHRNRQQRTSQSKEKVDEVQNKTVVSKDNKYAPDQLLIKVNTDEVHCNTDSLTGKFGNQVQEDIPETAHMVSKCRIAKCGLSATSDNVEKPKPDNCVTSTVDPEECVPDISCLTCPLCQIDVTKDEHSNHVTQCIRKNFCSEKFKGDAVANKEVQQSTASNNENYKSPIRTLDELKELCALCNKDITHLGAAGRQQHYNRCLDDHEEKEERKRLVEASVPNCPLCDRVLKSRKARTMHLKRCARTKKIPSAVLLVKSKKQEEEFAALKAAGSLPPSLISSRIRKFTTTTKRLAPKSAVDEMLQIQMAMALSASASECTSSDSHLLPFGAGRKTNGRKRRGKKAAADVVPLLLQRTIEETNRMLQEKIANNMRQSKEELSILEALYQEESCLKFPPSKLAVKYAQDENRENDVTLWNLCSASGDESIHDDRSSYYVSALVPPVSPCKIETGSKLRRFSEIYGWNKSVCIANDHVDVKQKGETKISQENHASQLYDPCLSQHHPAPPAATLLELEDTLAGYVELEQPCNAMSVLDDFGKMVASEIASDVIISTKQSKIPAHRFVFAARCRMLYKEFESSKNINWEIYNEDVVLSMLKYLYTGKIDAGQCDQSAFLQLAQRYGLTELVENCNKELKDSHSSLPIATQDILANLLSDDGDDDDGGGGDGIQVGKSYNLENRSIQSVLPEPMGETDGEKSFCVNKCISPIAESNLQENFSKDIAIFLKKGEAMEQSAEVVKDDISNGVLPLSCPNVPFSQICMPDENFCEVLLNDTNLELNKNGFCDMGPLVNNMVKDDCCKQALENFCLSNVQKPQGCVNSSATISETSEEVLLSKSVSSRCDSPSSVNSVKVLAELRPNLNFHSNTEIVETACGNDSDSTMKAVDSTIIDQWELPDLSVHDFNNVDTPASKCLSVDGDTTPDLFDSHSPQFDKMEESWSRLPFHCRQLFTEKHNLFDSCKELGNLLKHSDGICEKSMNAEIRIVEDDTRTTDGVSPVTNNPETKLRDNIMLTPTSTAESSAKLSNSKRLCEKLLLDSSVSDSFDKTLVNDTDAFQKHQTSKRKIMSASFSPQCVKRAKWELETTAVPFSSECDSFGHKMTTDCNKSVIEGDFAELKHILVHENIDNEAEDVSVIEIIDSDDNEVANNTVTARHTSTVDGVVDSHGAIGLPFCSQQQPRGVSETHERNNSSLWDMSDGCFYEMISEQVSSNEFVPPEAVHGRTAAIVKTPGDLCKNSSFIISDKVTPKPDFANMITPELKKRVTDLGIRRLPKKKMIAVLDDVYEQTHPVICQGGGDNSKNDISKITYDKKQYKQSLTTELVKNKTETKKQSNDRKKPVQGNHAVATADGRKKGVQKRDKKSGFRNQIKKQVSKTKTVVVVMSNDGDDDISEANISDSDTEDMPEESMLNSFDHLSQQTSQVDTRCLIMDFIRQNTSLYNQILQFEPILFSDIYEQLREAGIKCSKHYLLDFLDEQCITFTYGKPRSKQRRKSRSKKR